MVSIANASYQPRIRRDEGKEFIFDKLRKKWVLITPEEWVRQYMLSFFTDVMAYPASLIAVERGLQLPELQKRFDIVVYNKAGQPWMIVECKEMNVPLDAAVLDQVLRYNQALAVPYLVITNGTYCRAFGTKEGTLQELAALPGWPQGS